MAEGRIPEDLLYGGLVPGERGPERPLLRFKHVCKRNMKALNTDNRWEQLAADRRLGRQELGSALKRGEAKWQQAADERGTRRKNRQAI